jgi:hypothetical protein
MMCERVREQIPGFLAGRLDAAAREQVIEHLETCSGCRADVAELGAVWRGLESMKEPEPGGNMRARFLETLRAYEEGYREAQRRPAPARAKDRFWAGWFPAARGWQAAFAALLVMAGIAAGRYAMAPQNGSQASRSEIAQLQGQVENLRQLVALSLLQEQSPSARLRGVTYSYQISQPDKEVEQALLHAVNHDSNMNVRLSAVDALAKFASSADVRRGLIDSVAVQDSPLVQIAIIDLLVQVKAEESAAMLRKISEDPEGNPDVRQRAASALQRLEASR